MERSMTIGEAVVSFWKKGFKFSGRSRRREYWLSGLGHLIIFLLLALFAILLELITGGSMKIMKIYGFLTGEVFYWISFIPGMALGYRRLQDININGIYSIIFTVIFIPFLIMEYFIPDEKLFSFDNTLTTIHTVGMLLAVVAGLVFFILACITGTRGPNKYGADPKYKG
ncbi:DUF805 domain-containing protein [Macrococcus animalis]|uniref:DUF805 domain-containing protein n=1 Tax=Macrococcus animalis TaxID=3395467 RepID=UPI0039BE3BD1